MTMNEAAAALEQAGLVAKSYTWEGGEGMRGGDGTPSFTWKGGEGIRGGRSADLFGNPPIQVYQRAYGIDQRTGEDTFTVMHMIDDPRDFITYGVPSLEAAVELVLSEYRKAGLLP